MTSNFRSEATIAAALFLLFALAFFGDAFLGHRTLIPTGHLDRFEPWRSEQSLAAPQPVQQHDLIFQFYPWAHFLKESVSEGRFPLWNPYNYLGTPFYANPQTAVLFPGTWLHLLLPLRYSFTALFVLKLFLILYGTFLWLREQRLGLPAATFGALAFGLSMHTIVGLAFPYASVTALLPWLLLASRRLSTASDLSRGRLAFLATAVLAALLVFAGQPQSALVAYLVAMVWTLFGVDRGLRGQASFRVGAALLLGGLMASVQWVPSLAYSMESMVPDAPRFIQSGYPYSWSTFLNLIVPDFFGSIVEDSFWGFPGYHDMAFYSSALLLVLIPLGIDRETVHSRHLPALVGGLLALLLMTGIPPFEWLLDLPGLDLVRRNKLVPWLLLSLIYLAALGLDRHRRDRPGWRVALPAIASIAVAEIGHRYFHEFTSLGTDFDVWLGIARTTAIVAVAIITLLFAGRRKAGWILVSLLLLDLLLVSYSLNPRGDDRELYSRPQLADRVSQSDRPSPPRIYGFDGVFFPNSASVFGLQDVRGYDVMTPRRLFRYMQAVDPGLGNALGWLKRIPLEPLTRETRIRQVIEPWLQAKPELRDYLKSESYWSVSVDRVSRVDLFRALQIDYLLATDSGSNSLSAGAPLPRLRGTDSFLSVGGDRAKVGGVDVLRMRANQALLYADWMPSDDANALEQLAEVDDLSKTAIVEAKLPDPVQRSSLGRWELLEWSPHHLLYEVESQQPAVLAVLERYAEGWQAEVDGSKAQVFPCNYLFRGVLVPAGVHRVKMSYRPLMLRLGLFLTALGVAVLLAVIWRVQHTAVHPVMVTMPDSDR